jgi:hypothetical protein
MVAVAVFSFAIFLWAQRVALSRERIESMIGDVYLPDAAADEPLTRGA